MCKGIEAAEVRMGGSLAADGRSRVTIGAGSGVSLISIKRVPVRSVSSFILSMYKPDIAGIKVTVMVRPSALSDKGKSFPIACASITDVAARAGLPWAIDANGAAFSIADLSP